jgi:acyl-CoA synthetase (AMP-forming)/AMP-acid ligase II
VTGSELKIMDLVTAEELGPGGIGELWFRGPNVMRGYLHRAEATAATVTGDGWCRTGDIATIDQDGFLHIIDRLKELIKYKGFHVAPTELEGVLLSHPGIADAAVVASPDPEAARSPRPISSRRATPIRWRWPRRSSATWPSAWRPPYKRVRRYQFIEAISRTPSGKVIRRALIERERRAAGIAVT